MKAYLLFDIKSEHWISYDARTHVQMIDHWDFDQCCRELEDYGYRHFEAVSIHPELIAKA